MLEAAFFEAWLFYVTLSTVCETLGVRSGGSYLMRDNELRGLILEALYSQRRNDMVDLDQELCTLPVPYSATERKLVFKRGRWRQSQNALSGHPST
jgi:hypothetical protein